MTASLLPADDVPGEPGAGAVPRLPKYYKVKRQLLELTAALDAGSPVPPERELARSYGTSRTTVRQALAELLGIRPGGRALRIHRLRLADGEPMSIDTSHLPARRFPGLRKQLERHT